MQMSKILSMLIYFSTISSLYANDFPTKLFGVELGKVYSVSENYHNLPIKQLTGSKQFMGAGFHYYFEPLKQYESFEYIKENTQNKYYETSFRLYVFPILEKNLKTVDDFYKTKNYNVEVALIEWSDQLIKKDETTSTYKDKAYSWAKDMCENFKLDIKSEPKITDYPSDKWYQCEFIKGNNQLEVSSLLGNKTIKLEYNKKFFDKRNIEVENLFRKLTLEKIRPYE